MPSHHALGEPREEIEKILRAETVGFLGLCVDGAPYVVPLSYCYTEGRIVFHCALKGKKLDMLKANPQVCFTIGRQYGEVTRHPQGAQCSADYESVICYGTARIVEEIEERRRVLNAFNHSMQPGAQDISLADAAKCCAVEIEIAEMTGKQHKAGKKTVWRYEFVQNF